MNTRSATRSADVEDELPVASEETRVALRGAKILFVDPAVDGAESSVATMLRCADQGEKVIFPECFANTAIPGAPRPSCFTGSWRR